MNLEDLYDLIDELLNVDVVEDAELGMRVREWYEKQNQNDDDEWEDLMSEEMDWGDDEWD
jgi:hypothetical protein